MKPDRWIRVALAAGTLLVALMATPADAQQGARGRGGVPLPPPVASTPEALLQRDFAYMRATSPNPSRFPVPLWSTQLPPMAVSPGYRVRFPRFGGGFFGGGVFWAPGFGGSWWQPGYQLNTNNYAYYGAPVVQREVYVYRDGAPAPPAEPEAAPRPERGEDFYLRDPATAERLTDALDEIRRAWLNGDFERIRARVPVDREIRVFLNGDFRYAIGAADLLGMLREAMGRIDTVAFELGRPRATEAGGAFVAGRHTFMDAEDQRQQSYISYGLERVGGRWMIVEVGSSDTPVSAHRE